MNDPGKIWRVVLLGLILQTGAWILYAENTNSERSATRTMQIETEKLLESIIIPSLKIEGATLPQAVDLLRREAVKNSPDGKGVSIEIDLRFSKSELKIPKGIDSELLNEILKLDEKARPPQNPTVTNELSYPPITLNLRDIPLFDALKLVTDLSGLRFVVHSNTVVVCNLCPDKELRIYKVKEGELNKLLNPENNSWFPSYPPGMNFLPKRNLIIVIAPSENLELLENVLRQVGGSVERFPSYDKAK